MKEKFEKLTLIWIIAVFLFSVMTVPVFTGFPPRYFDNPGKGAATLYVTPQDSNFTSTKPADNRTGETFTVNVRIANATYVASWQVEITYNKNYINTSLTDISYAADHIFPPGTYSPITPSIDSYNTTHNYILMTAATTSAVEYNATDKGLMTINFTIIADPDLGETLSCMLYLQKEAAIFGTWTADYNVEDNDITLMDGYYENKYVSLPPAWLEISPTLKRMPTIEGDRINGTSRALFTFDILINDANPADELFLVQLILTFNKTLVKGIWVDEGTFMNDARWSPHGTFDNASIPEEGKLTYWVMLAPNASGYWDNNELGLTWPTGDGLLCTAQLEIIGQFADSDGVAPEELVASSYLNISSVYGEFFLGYPNKEPEPDYLPYSSPVNATVDIYGYYWSLPVAAFSWTPEQPLITEVVSFDASSSVGYRNNMSTLVPENAYLKTYFWDFGDGANATMVGVGNNTVTYTYTLPGDYNVSLTVTDKDGKTDTELKPLTIVEEIIHQINWSSYTFYVKTVSDTSISPVNFTQTHRFLRFTATSHFGSSFFCNITIPKQLLYSQEDMWYILLDGTQILPTEYVVTENGNTTIHIPYSGSTHTIHIFGTSVIPEFPEAMLPAIFSLMTLLAFVIIAEKRWSQHRAKTSMKNLKTP